MSLIETFLAHASDRPDAPAIIDPSERVATYGGLDTASAARAAGMARAGIGAGDVVLIARGVSIELYETLLAVFRLGAVAMFPEPAAGLAGLRQAVKAARPKAVATAGWGKAIRWAFPELRALTLVGDPDAKAAGDMFSPVAGEAPALITFTSGSTGRPKGVLRSADFLMLQHRLLEEIRKTSPDDVDLISLPVFILSNLAAGAASVIPAGKLTRPAQLDGTKLRAQILLHRTNRIVAPPAVCERLVRSEGPSLAKLEAVFTGGGPVFPNLLQDLSNAAPDARIHAVYGSTEAEPIAHIEAADISSADWKRMSEGGGLLAGRPIAEAKLDLVEDEIWVAGPHVNKGYLDRVHNAASKVERDGEIWHRTGDAARLDEEGRLWLLGRVEAGQGGVYPFAVETAALSWPGVAQAALAAGDGRMRLALAPAKGASLDMAALRRRAAALAIDGLELVAVSDVPMDKRHNSKVDYARLRRRLG